MTLGGALLLIGEHVVADAVRGGRNAGPLVTYYLDSEVKSASFRSAAKSRYEYG
jgi:hypothetical protein